MNKRCTKILLPLLAGTMLSACSFNLMPKTGAEELATAIILETEGNANEAITHYENAISQATDSRFRSKAQIKLASLYRRGGKNLQPDGEKAADILEMAVQGGNEKVILTLANTYYKGDGIEQDIEAAKKLYKQIEETSPQARINLAIINQNDELANSYNTSEKLKDAIEQIEWKAVKGSKSSSLLLARTYREGRLVEANNNTAESWYRKAIELGSKRAAIELSWAWLEQADRPNFQDDALNLLTQAADSGYTPAMYDLGKLYMNGYTQTNTQKTNTSIETKVATNTKTLPAEEASEIQTSMIDREKSIEWYKKAANEDHSGAMVALGQHYLAVSKMPESTQNEAMGDADEKPMQLAINWFTKASLYNEPSSWLSLGRLHYNGAEPYIKRDIKKAIPMLQTAYDLGSNGASKELADAYLYGNGVSRNPTKAITLYREMAENNSISSQKILGLFYLNGTFVRKDYVQARYYLQMAADNGSASANKKLAEIYSKGIGTKRDYSRAIKHFKLAANKGDVTAMEQIAHAYRRGYGTPKNQAKAFYWYSKAANKGSAKSMLEVAFAYGSGKGVKRSRTLSDRWMNKAIKADPKKVISVAKAYAKGKGVPRNPTKALQLYKRAAKAGNPMAVAYLAKAYNKGIGTKANSKQSISYLKKLASKGNPAAMHELGKAYASGRGIDANMKTAIDWYKKAAKSGHSASYIHIAKAYSVGLGVEQNATTAIDWYEKAAKAGNSKGQYQLGLAYARGVGREKNYELAEKWLSKSQGDYPAAKAILTSLK